MGEELRQSAWPPDTFQKKILEKVQKELLEIHLKLNPNELHSKNILNEIIQEIQKIASSSSSSINLTSSSSSSTNLTSSSSSSTNLLEELDDELLNFQGGGYIKYAHRKYKIRIGPKGGQYILRYGKKIYV